MNVLSAMTAVAGVLPIGVVMWLLPTLSQPTVPLGVSVPAARADDPAVRSATGRYRQRVLTATAVAVVCVFLLAVPDGEVWSWLTPLVPTLGLIAVGTAAWLAGRAQLRRVRDRDDWYGDVRTGVVGSVVGGAGSSVTRIVTPGVPWIWYVASLAVTVAATVTLAGRWGSIPETVVTHLDRFGRPDGWGSRSIGDVFLAQWFALGVTVVMIGVAVALSRIDVRARSAVSAPARARTAVSLSVVQEGLAVLTLLLSLGFAAVGLTTALPELQAWTTAAVALMTVGSVVAVLGMLVAVVVRVRTVDDAARRGAVADAGVRTPGGDVVEPLDHGAYYKAGMIYHNPDDPAVFVDRRHGVGVTVNTATWQGKALLAALVALVVVVVAVVLAAAV
ncbi:DUF5808 domain-containing protein [Corynebacterium bovis]|uniref:Putative membrane protein n=1 Tax=Corynebacterium bovis DSM 20582 = CIP 54.80 TaxID=927655 RepID=A0A8H9Y7E2_9CORY|nr:DUF5808 domain-containing protein [Corynebacterium bovis]MBB3115775.1 putative membrane protein [Corynebacterium bovis DSM 20582 = CIP 54.80]QQC47448.1 hypothetical protein I6I09_00015 [Corynebacterium bovis]RRO83709.1 hypothetical protein CXF36_02205 [Corynebacterium bovis]RRO84714.1 hypothetical protein CXF37_02285 [Corynebacterium bovis]RRO96156.1 hypothetical protein CXF29_02880 [Corynebacterium bovis]